MGHGRGKSCSSYELPPPRIFDDFENYNIGPLGGQGDWVDTTPGMTVSTTRYEKYQGVTCGVPGNPIVWKDTPIIADGYVRCMMMHTGPITSPPLNPSQAFFVNNPTGGLIGFIAIRGSICQYRSNGAFFTLKLDLVSDHWYKLWIFWQSSPARVKYRIDDEPATGWLLRGTADATGPVSRIHLSAEWWDVGDLSCFDYLH